MGRWQIAIVLAGLARPALAGPPYLTDDPDPTDTDHWEIYTFAQGEGNGSALDADAGLDLNYGAVEDVQLTATLPMHLSHEPSRGWLGGTGDVEFGIKYRFLHDREDGFSAAIFPRLIVPTASHAPGEKARVLLPMWIGKDLKGGTRIFGGGGYLINPGAGNRNFWQAALAVTQDLGEAASIGAEITRQGPEAAGGTAETRAGVGSIIKLSRHSNVLLSAGPTFADHRTSLHAYVALGFNY